MATVNLQIDTEGAAAIRALVKVAQSQDKVEQSTRRAGRASQKQAQSTDKSSEAFERTTRKIQSMIATATGIGGIAVLMNRVKDSVLAVDEALAAIARKQSSIGTLSASLSALNPGRGDDVVRRAVLAGAAEGISPADAISTVQVLQSISENQGNFEAALRDAQEVFALTNLGVEPDKATAAVKLFRRAGFGAGAAGTSLLTAADASSFGPTELGGAGRALSEFKDPQVAFAAASRISAILTDPGQLGVFTENAGRALNLPNPFNEGIAKRLEADALRGAGQNPAAIAKALGLANAKSATKLLASTPEGVSDFFGSSFSSLGELEKLAAIRAVVPESRSEDVTVRNAALKGAGLTEQRQLKGLSALTSDNDFSALVQIVDDTVNAADGLAQRRVEEEVKTNTLFRQAKVREATVAVQQARQLFNPRARAAGQARLSAGAALQAEAPIPELLVNQDTGEANLAGRAVQALRRRGGLLGLAVGAGGSEGVVEDAGPTLRDRELADFDALQGSIDGLARELGIGGASEGEADTGRLVRRDQGSGLGFGDSLIVGSGFSGPQTAFMQVFLEAFKGQFLDLLTEIVSVSPGTRAPVATVPAFAGGEGPLVDALSANTRAVESNTAASRGGGDAVSRADVRPVARPVVARPQSTEVE